MGGRLVLIKFVLSSIPVYFLSFFKAPTGIISLIESIFKAFLWGGSEDSRKINWIKWDKVCLDKERGVLGVRRVKEFNLSLLGKWCWRLLKEPEGLWCKVLNVKYGIMDVQVNSGGSNASSWWKDIISIRCGNDAGGGSWFHDNVERKVGDVADMCRSGWGLGGNGWVWRRRLFAWEEELWGECCFALANIVLRDSLSDSWVWLPDPNAGYSVGGAYHLLSHLILRDLSTDSELV
ncbi:hypothetical protein TSUD_141420 [Trifolium subterraneum]|uniref:Reverse transcriptase zinc-binding domain-containing protein n=1 Tax=Trifolium subterraneum TaxID=3900 RepID=A0A2Z6PCX4_TRISU|nr:hypothetical protein TSUD_141420 [Trifolium subterraneum]